VSDAQLLLLDRAGRIHGHRPGRLRDTTCREIEGAAGTAFLRTPFSLSTPRKRYVPNVSEPALPAACISGGQTPTGANGAAES
jgi:hypothetical protein